MKKTVIIILISTLFSSMTAAGNAEPASVDAPLLNQTNTRVNETIFTQQKNGVLSDAQAARLQVRRQSIMQEANDRRNRNKGLLPTSDASRLIRRMEALDKQVSRVQ